MRSLLIALILAFTLPNCSRTSGRIFKDTRSTHQELKLCFLGNLERSNQRDSVRQALEKLKCDQIYLLGNNGDSEQVSQLFSPLFEKNNKLQINFVLGPEDHRKNPTQWRDLAKSNPRYFFPNYFYLVDYGGLCVLALDTGLYHYRRPVDEISQQKEFLNDATKNLHDCQVKIAATHDSLSFERARPFLEKYVIGASDIAVSGDLPLQDRGNIKGTTVLSTGIETVPGIVVLTWNPSQPREISYQLQAIPKQKIAQNIEREEARVSQLEVDDLIDKEVVEQGPIKRILKAFKNFFREVRGTEKKETARFKNAEKKKRGE
jgi:hypothetical protein